MNQLDSELKAMPVYASPVNDNIIIKGSTTKKENPHVREINSCLVPCEQCTGTYVDSISGTLLRIICSCSCHSEKQEALAQVGSPSSNASDSLCQRRGSNDDK
jgi:hypothetical protein